MASYILDNWDTKLVEFSLKKMNELNYFRVSTICNMYIEEVLRISRYRKKEKTIRSTSVKIGRVVRELKYLGVIEYFTNSSRKVWKNPYKGNLIQVMEKKMEEKYFLIKMKNNKQEECD